MARENEYNFTYVFKPMERGMDIAVLNWKNGYCFLVNNPDCVTVRLTDGSGVTTDIPIEKNAYPYLFYEEIIPAEYVFLRADGTEIP